MGKIRKPRAGKDFEQLVARIEEMLAPIGAVVKSPDRIRDLVTGQMREVDATIRVQDGDETRLIMVECRDHPKYKQDDRWIEQLVTKREKLGAWKTIAVSSTGFSDPAITTASHYGIELRRIDQISDVGIVKEWVGDFTSTILAMEIGALEITIYDEGGNFVSGDSLTPEVSEALNRDLFNTNFLHVRGQEYILSASDIAQIVGTPDGLTEGGPPVRAIASMSFANKDHYVETPSGELFLSKVLVGLEYYIRPIPVPFQSVKQYSSPDKPLMEMLEGAVRLDDRTNLKLQANVSLNKPLPVTKKSRKRRPKSP